MNVLIAWRRTLSLGVLGAMIAAASLAASHGAARAQLVVDINNPTMEPIPVAIPGLGRFEGIKTSVFLEVEGAGHYLPPYAGNLDIMTSAALATAERIATRRLGQEAA